ncbi:recombinase family protein [Mesorhizobium sp. LjNodule214]|uniref:recombinase family protein n=1 Tax=Mesorhizobium sp. LjNodule214 TaxID=3342252 RepID=UPI003F502677
MSALSELDFRPFSRQDLSNAEANDMINGRQAMSDKALRQAVAYLRTSSAANVGADKDSERRQREAIEAFARSAGFEVVETYYDAAVSGADPVTARPGFSAMLERLLSNGVRTILVETASRFARDLIVQETGYEMLKSRGIELIAVDSPDSFVGNTPTANLIRQVLGAVSEFEKAMLVEKLKGARERKRRETGKKVGGRRNYAEIDGGLELIALAKKLHRYPVNGRQRTLADVAKALADTGYLSSAGTQYTPTAVSRMLASSGSALARQRKVETKSSPSALEPAAAELQQEVAELAMRTPLGSRW